MVLPGFLRQNNCPGLYADLASEATGVLPAAPFDGLSVVVQGRLGPLSASSASALSRRAPPRQTATVSRAARWGSVSASLDLSKNASGSVELQPLGDDSLVLRVAGELAADKAPVRRSPSAGERPSTALARLRALAAEPTGTFFRPAGRAELHVRGGDFGLTAIGAIPERVGAASLLLAPTPTLAVGAEYVYVQPRAKHMVAAGAKYAAVLDSEKLSALALSAQANTERSASLTAMYQPRAGLSLAAKVDLDARGASGPREGGRCAQILALARGVAVEAAAGVRRTYPRAQVSASLSSDLVATAEARHALGPGAAATVVATADLRTGRVGTGLALVLAK